MVRNTILKDEFYKLVPLFLSQGLTCTIPVCLTTILNLTECILNHGQRRGHQFGTVQHVTKVTCVRNFSILPGLRYETTTRTRFLRKVFSSRTHRTTSVGLEHHLKSFDKIALHVLHLRSWSFLVSSHVNVCFDNLPRHSSLLSSYSQVSTSCFRSAVHSLILLEFLLLTL